MVYSSRVPASIAKIVFKGFIAQFERDVPIWDNKMLLRKPHLAKNDGPISRLMQVLGFVFLLEGCD